MNRDYMGELRQARPAELVDEPAPWPFGPRRLTWGEVGIIAIQVVVLALAAALVTVSLALIALMGAPA
jgi:hypothetical protein